MAIVSTDLLKEGMILSSPVKNQQDQVLFGAGLVLKEKHINMMQAWGVGEADVKLDENEQDEAAQRLKQAIRAFEEKLRPRFVRCDTEHPMVREIIRFCAERRAEKMNRQPNE